MFIKISKGVPTPMEWAGRYLYVLTKGYAAYMNSLPSDWSPPLLNVLLSSKTAWPTTSTNNPSSIDLTALLVQVGVLSLAVDARAEKFKEPLAIARDHIGLLFQDFYTRFVSSASNRDAWKQFSEANPRFRERSAAGEKQPYKRSPQPIPLHPPQTESRQPRPPPPVAPAFPSVPRAATGLNVKPKRHQPPYAGAICSTAAAAVPPIRVLAPDTIVYYRCANPTCPSPAVRSDTGWSSSPRCRTCEAAAPQALTAAASGALAPVPK